jgi:hypothetical protein
MEEKAVVRREALEIIREHIQHANICLMTNNILDWPLQPEPLGNQWADNDGNIWFMSFSATSDRRVLNGTMEVFYSNRTRGRFLSIVGRANSASWAEVEDVEGFPFKSGFTETAETPITLLKFFPEEAFFWDNEINDMVPLLLFDPVNEKRTTRIVA